MKNTIWKHLEPLESALLFLTPCWCYAHILSIWWQWSSGKKHNMDIQLFQRTPPGHCFKYYAQSCPTLCDPVDCSLPGSPDHGMCQARILEWVARPSCRVSSRPRNWTRVSYETSPALTGAFFTTSATWEAQKSLLNLLQYCFCIMFGFLTTRLVGSQLPDQG